MKRERVIGVDILRIIAMFLIVIQHVLGRGGVLDNATFGSLKYYSAWSIEISAMIAVDIYMLISGYVMYGSSCRYSKLVERWLHVVVYSLGLYLLFADVYTVNGILGAAMPITSRRYWYMSTYFAMYLITPILNCAIERLDMRSLGVIVAGMMVAFSILPTIMNADFFLMHDGFSPLWMAVMYIIGAVIRKYEKGVHLSSKRLSCLLVGSMVLTCILKFGWGWLCYLRSGEPLSIKGAFIHSHVSPLIVLSSVCALLLAVKINIQNKYLKRKIVTVSNGTLGVYLLHVQPEFFERVLCNYAASFVEYSVPLMVFLVFLSALVIFIGCMVVEVLRSWLFCRLKVSQICTCISEQLNKNCMWGWNIIVKFMKKEFHNFPK